jgi:uncharacterized repeat protein (TIGR02543 family)
MFTGMGSQNKNLAYKVLVVLVVIAMLVGLGMPIRGGVFAEDTDSIVTYYVGGEVYGTSVTIPNPDGDILIGEADLSADAPDEEVWPEGAVAFTAWYTSPEDAEGNVEGNRFNFESLDLLPAAISLYAGFSYIPISPFAEGTWTVTFISDGAVFDTKEAADGGTIEEPGLPNFPDGFNSFLGWYEAGSPTAFDFSSAISTDITLYAQFDAKYTVQFLNADGNVYTTGQYAAGESIWAPVVAPPAGEGYRLLHWYVQGDDTETPAAFPITVSENLTLVPKFSNTYNLIFVSAGTQAAPQVLGGGALTAEPSLVMTRPGYDFAGWWDKPQGTDGAQLFVFGGTISQTTFVYAHWTPKSVDVKVQYWVEKPNFSGDPGTNPDNYIYVTSDTKSAAAGSVISYNSGISLTATASLPGALKYSEPTPVFGDTNVTVQGNGQTIINVYYKRIIYTVNFDMVKSGSTMSANGSAKTDGSGVEYTLQAKYEQSLGNLWPTEVRRGWDGLSYYIFQGWLGGPATSAWVDKKLVFSEDMIPASGRTYQLDAQWTTITTGGGWRDYTVNVYLENESGQYILSPAYSYTAWLKTNPGYSSISGYTVRTSAPNASESHKTGDLSIKIIVTIKYGEAWVSNFYYDRARLKVDFDSQGGSAIPSATNILNGASLAGARPTTNPTRDDYKFLGWYAQPGGFGQPFDFDTERMPGQNLVLYAAWEPDAYHAHFYDAIGSANEVGTQGLVLGGYASPLAGYVPGVTSVEGKGVFRAWVWNVGGEYVDFNFDIPMSKESGRFDLYAVYTTTGFKITYDGNGYTEGTVPSDDNPYVLGTPVSVQNGAGLLKGTDVFAGWQIDGTGKIYYPGNTITISRNTTLKARYVSAADAVTVTYHANNPGEISVNPSTVSQYASSSDTAFTLANKDIFTAPADWFIDYWTTDSAGNGTHLAPGNDYSWADLGLSSKQVHLYAHWKHADITVTFDPGTTGGRLNTLSPGTQFAASVPYGTKWNDSAFTAQVPTVTPPYGYYFAGWSPALPTNVANVNVETYTAVYAPKQSFAIIANAIREYSGVPRTVTDADGGIISTTLPVGYTLAYVSVTATGTNAGVYPFSFNTGSYSVIYDEDGTNVTDHFYTPTTSGSLTITKKTVVVSAAVTAAHGDAAPAEIGRAHV